MLLFCLGFDGCIDDVCLGLFRNCLWRCLVEIVVYVLIELEYNKVSLNSLYLGIDAPIAHPKIEGHIPIQIHHQIDFS